MREGVGWKVEECQDERRSWLEGRRMPGLEKEMVRRQENARMREEVGWMKSEAVTMHMR